MNSPSTYECPLNLLRDQMLRARSACNYVDGKTSNESDAVTFDSDEMKAITPFQWCEHLLFLNLIVAWSTAIRYQSALTVSQHS